MKRNKIKKSFRQYKYLIKIRDRIEKIKQKQKLITEKLIIENYNNNNNRIIGLRAPFYF